VKKKINEKNGINGNKGYLILLQNVKNA